MFKFQYTVYLTIYFTEVYFNPHFVKEDFFKLN